MSECRHHAPPPLATRGRGAQIRPDADQLLRNREPIDPGRAPGAMRVSRHADESAPARRSSERHELPWRAMVAVFAFEFVEGNTVTRLYTMRLPHSALRRCLAPRQAACGPHDRFPACHPRQPAARGPAPQLNVGPSPCAITPGTGIRLPRARFTCKLVPPSAEGSEHAAISFERERIE